METINVKIIHPTNNSDIDIGLPKSMLLRDVFSQLVDANFLSAWQPYTGVLKPAGARLGGGGEQRADAVPDAGEGGHGARRGAHRVGAGGAEHRGDREVAAQLAVPGERRQAGPSPLQRGGQDVEDQRRLAAAGHPGDHGERAGRERRVDTLERVRPRPEDLEVRG